jgi:hypothetical protein
MFKTIGLVSFLALLASPVFAQQPLSADELKALIVGKSLTYGTDGIATYKTDGSYEYYNKNTGQTSRGKYSVQGDRICADFGGGRNRCDQIIKMPTGLVLKNSQGTTFPVAVK